MSNSIKLTAANIDALYHSGADLATAEAGFDFSVQSTTELFIKTAKAKRGDTVPFEVFDTVTRYIAAGYDGAAVSDDYKMSDGARQKRSRIKSLSLSDYGVRVADKPKSTKKDSAERAKQREAAQARKQEVAALVQKHAEKEGTSPAVAAEEIANRKTSAKERKEVRAAVSYIAEQEEAQHKERVKAAKGAVSKFVSDVKLNECSPEQLEILEAMAALIK